MTLYRVIYSQRLRVEYLVEAESKEEAQELVESGELYDPKEEIVGEDLISLEEIGSEYDILGAFTQAARQLGLNTQRRGRELRSIS